MGGSSFRWEALPGVYGKIIQFLWEIFPVYDGKLFYFSIKSFSNSSGKLCQLQWVTFSASVCSLTTFMGKPLHVHWEPILDSRETIPSFSGKLSAKGEILLHHGETFPASMGSFSSPETSFSSFKRKFFQIQEKAFPASGRIFLSFSGKLFRLL